VHKKAKFGMYPTGRFLADDIVFEEEEKSFPKISGDRN